MDEGDLELLANRLKTKQPRNNAVNADHQIQTVYGVITSHVAEVFSSRNNVDKVAYAIFLKQHLQKGLQTFLTK